VAASPDVPSMVIGANPNGRPPRSRIRDEARPCGERVRSFSWPPPVAIDLVRSAHIEADHHLQLKPGTNVGESVNRWRTCGDEGLDRRVRSCPQGARDSTSGRNSPSPPPPEKPRGRRPIHRACCDEVRAAAPDCMPQAATGPSYSALSESPNTARARRWLDGAWRTWRWPCGNNRPTRARP